MKKKDDIINQAISNIREVLAQIDQGNVLTEEDCQKVMEDIANLRALNSLPTYDDLDVMKMDIENMLTGFNASADSSKELLEHMLTVITEGKVPEVSDVKRLDLSILELRQKYNAIYSMAMVETTSEEMPEEGASVTEYVEAIKNSASLLYKKQLDAMTHILQKFVSVQSFVSNYAAALQPYQQEAGALLSEMSGNETPVEELEEKIAGPKVFLEAIDCEDIDSDEGLDLLDQVSEYYPRRIQNGLAAGKYYIPEMVESDAQSVSAQPADMAEIKDFNNEKEKNNKSAEPEKALVNAEIESDAEEEIAERKDSDQIEVIDEEDISEAVTNKEISEFAQKVLESGLLIEDSSSVGQLICGVSNNESKKITASIFQNDIRKGNEKALKAIIEEISDKNILTRESLLIKKGMPLTIAETCLEYLIKKGYLRKYQLGTLGGFYCASSRLIKALTFKAAAKTVGLRQMTSDDWGENIEDKSTSAAARLAYIKMCQDGLDYFLELDKTSVAESRTNSKDGFLSMLYPKDKSLQAIIGIGVFWENTDESDEFLENTRNYFNDDTEIGKIIFSSISKEKAKTLANLMQNELGEVINSAQIYLYSLLDDEYYTYPNGMITELKPSLDGETDEDSEEDETADLSESADALIDKSDLNKREITDLLQDEASTAVETKDIIAKENSGEKVEDLTGVNEPEEQTFMNQIFSLICNRDFYAATAFAKAVSDRYSKYELFYKQLSHALNDPMGHCVYSTDNVFTLIDKKGDFEDALVISTAIRTFFSNQVRYDYNIKSYYSGIKEYKMLNDYPSLSKVVYTLMEFKDNQQKGMDAYADYRSKSKAELDQKMRNLQREASTFYDNFVIGHKKENARQRRFLETKKLIFSADTDLGQYIKAVVDGDTEFQPIALEFISKHFYKDDSIINESTIDSDKLWEYISEYWDKAGDLMTYRRHENLMSHLRGNIVSITTKAVQILAKWCDLVERISNREEDEGDKAYKKVRKTLIDNISDVISEMNNVCSEELTELSEKAGLKVLIYTVQEIQDCLTGEYDETSKEYFYVPFLLTSDLMLNEEYLPDLDMHSSTIKALYPTTRILDHVAHIKAGRVDYKQRLNSMLEDGEDNYGAAKLIIDYLLSKEPTEELSDISEKIDSGTIYAKETADLRKEDFIGELELAQSYGQIDNSVEDKKEKILQIVDGWYEWALESNNYEFFKHVMDVYLDEIRKEAKSREKTLLEELDNFKKTTVSGLSAEKKERRINKIQEMIHQQNYTVAEDLLNRSSTYEDEHEDLIDEDFLKEFLDHYEDYYKPVAVRNKQFASLVTAKTRNKEQRGAKRLADNWLPGGSNLGKERLFNLLNSLGFKVASIREQTSIGKFEHFYVMTERAKGGQRDNYTHPIAAFGSGAAQDGFRVVCINGAYDSDGLIEIMKEIGNARHTMILYDNALSMSERRRLARKTKNSLGDKLFAVVDRTVMMYLVRNYNETKMNKMLFALVTPFGYYQPYVWESANVMPPEIFMGRKRELEDIKSPTGVNIVYGGRQLGKSALLKKAKEDIDWDENENRAVLVDIKGLDYKQAAKKIGHELYDAFVLEDDIETEDWTELARVVRRRLQSKTKVIPYLLLLLDEADVFIDSCASVNYQPFDALKEIQSIGAGRFKFVIAGLRNIVRFKREALGNNSVLTHLQAMTVKPFNTLEARELLEVPLHYLGLRFPKKDESLITLILASTNYFPGLIQMYCAKLINAMRDKDYANYDEADTPIYEVSEEHIKKILADPEFTQQIREKYIITLRLDEDNYYYLIALLMAYLYHSNGYNEGYSAEDIKNVGVELEITKIANLELTKLEAFMEELKELNVLRDTDDNHYLFTRFTFFQMMGTRTEVDDKLEEHMGE